MSTVECITLNNERIFLPNEKLVFRPSAYAVILHAGMVLLVNTRSTSKYSLPGGGVELGERDEAVEDGEVEAPRWVNWRNLVVNDFQNHGDLILEILAEASTVH
jgi:hypothetical protein